MTRPAKGDWTNPSVLAFAGDAEPIDAIRERARNVVVDALDGGWAGPPFDPLALAELLHLEVVATQDVVDARTVATSGRHLRIEFNPSRSRGRVRYSLAHEIAHTFFLDCADRVRHRGAHGEREDDGWQLEVLCNVAAAELLMPFGSLPRVGDFDLDELQRLRARFEVSAEAIFIRMVELSEPACAVIAASPTNAAQYRIDYVIGSRSWRGRVSRRSAIPRDSALHECTAIGYTAKKVEVWGETRCRAEFVGLPSYPGATKPRVIGLLRPTSRQAAASAKITYLHGDATSPRGEGPKLIVHVVNDATSNWGGAGFAMAVRRKWPEVQDVFRSWSGAGRPALGASHFARAEPNVEIASLVAQRGYGPSASPRIRYAALKQTLEAASRHAASVGASVHMPRIGCGQAGGSWDVVEELVAATFCGAGVSVYVYDRPGTTPRLPAQPSLPWSRSS